MSKQYAVGTRVSFRLWNNNSIGTIKRVCTDLSDPEFPKSTSMKRRKELEKEMGAYYVIEHASGKTYNKYHSQLTEELDDKEVAKETGAKKRKVKEEPKEEVKEEKGEEEEESEPKKKRSRKGTKTEAPKTKKAATKKVKTEK